MKTVILFLTLLILPVISYAQNNDEPTSLLSSQRIDNRSFENALEAIRVNSSIEFTTTTVDIDSNVAVGDSINLADDRLIAIIMPSAWTTAALTFQASLGNGVWYNVYKEEGTELSYAAATSRWIIVKPTDFAGMKYLKIRSGTSGTPVSQADDRSIGIVKRGY